MDILRFKIPNIDRVGLVLDISRILANHQINITGMEVERNTVYLEIELPPTETKQCLLTSLKLVPQIIDVIEIDLLPHQEKAEQLKAVLGSVNDGIIAVDHQGYITQYNPAAEKIVHFPAKDAIGKFLTEIFPPDIPLLDAVKRGTIYNNREMMLPRTKSHYLSSGRPIMDSTGHIIGAVATLRDISEVRKMVYSITGQSSLSFGEMLYASEAMQKVVSIAKAIAQGDSNVLIRGETGTGKELFARAIHAASPRANNIFVPLNCAAIPDALLESELFGYKEGAFTGAVKGGKPGLFEFANHGTIFLDEISEVPLHLQAKLLRVLQENKVRRLGDNREISVDVRVLAATNSSLEKMMEESKFREDLYYRLNVIPLFVPPLRERTEDIPLLAQFFLQRFAVRLQKPVSTMSETALTKLSQYHWPGNVRELENVMERAVNIIDGTILLAEHIIFDHDYAPSCPTTPILSEKKLEELVAEVEKDALLKSLAHNHTLRQMGQSLGISHTAVLKKLRKYDLPLPEKNNAKKQPS